MEATATVLRMGEIRFTGNIIPPAWFQSITYASGKPDLLAIMLLSEFCYWYRPREIRSERTGEIVRYERRFAGEWLQKSYADLAEQFGVSQRQVRDAVVRLEELGLIRRLLLTRVINGVRVNNIMHIDVYPDAIEKITHPEYADAPQRDPSLVSARGLPRLNETDPSFDVGTNTENTTETIEREQGPPLAPLPPAADSAASPAKDASALSLITQALGKPLNKQQAEVAATMPDLARLARVVDKLRLAGGPINLLRIHQWYMRERADVAGPEPPTPAAGAPPPPPGAQAPIVTALDLMHPYGDDTWPT